MLKELLEAIFEPLFSDHSYGFRPEVVKYVEKRKRCLQDATIHKWIRAVNSVVRAAKVLWECQLRGNPIVEAKAMLRVSRQMKPGNHHNRQLEFGEVEKLRVALGQSLVLRRGAHHHP